MSDFAQMPSLHAVISERKFTACMQAAELLQTQSAAFVSVDLIPTNKAGANSDEPTGAGEEVSCCLAGHSIYDLWSGPAKQLINTPPLDNVRLCATCRQMLLETSQSPLQRRRSAMATRRSASAAHNPEEFQLAHLIPTRLLMLTRLPSHCAGPWSPAALHWSVADAA